MTASAHDIAAVLRQRLPGLPTVKLHKLLYYCQGHHLAHFGEPLFSEAVCAWDMGPVVAAVWAAEKHSEPRGASGTPLDEGQLNTIGYVLSRYGGMTGADLIKLSHEETPWREANIGRPPGTSVTISHESIREYFSTEGAAETSEVVLDAGELAALVAGAEERRHLGSGSEDTVESIRAWAERG